MTGVVIPSLGGRHLAHCLEAVAATDPKPRITIVVVSGRRSAAVGPSGVELVTVAQQLGFAAAVNTGLARLGPDIRRVAVLNDDAVPGRDWLATLGAALDRSPDLAAVQGTVTDAVGARIDGRGIALDELGLPIQVERGGSPAPEPSSPRHVVAVSGTAALYRLRALRTAALGNGAVFDPRFGSYHEDLDLGLRLRRLGWSSQWTPGAWASHVGSATGRKMGWRHPWWLLVNRWRALAGNLTGAALVRALPRLLRGELRAVHTLIRDNPRAAPTAVAAVVALPWIVAGAARRRTPGARLQSLKELCR